MDETLKAFDYQKQYCKYLEEYLIIYDENTNLDFTVFNNMEIEDIKLNLEKY